LKHCGRVSLARTTPLEIQYHPYHVGISEVDGRMTLNSKLSLPNLLWTFRGGFSQ